MVHLVIPTKSIHSVVHKHCNYCQMEIPKNIHFIMHISMQYVSQRHLALFHAISKTLPHAIACQGFVCHRQQVFFLAF